MVKYKVCPSCNTHNPPNLLECISCEADLTGIRIIDELTEQKNISEPIVSPTPTDMVRICECGTKNPVAARKCTNCGEDISDVLPTPESQEVIRFVLASIDGNYAFELTEPIVEIGREQKMQDYLSCKSFVSRLHATLEIKDNKLFITNKSNTNFTYVNNKKIGEDAVSLEDGDEIGLGGLNINGNRQDDAAYFTVRIGTCI